MIPILYEKTEVDFSTYGIGALADVTSCVCTEERNGQYECLFTYPITGVRYDEIQAERIVKVKAKPLGDDQLFRIYRISRPIHGIVTVYAQHISYDLSGVAVTPFSASLGPEQAMTRLFAGTSFIAHSDKSGSKTFGPDVPQSVRAMLGGTAGSVLQQWGGEYKWDNFDVYLLTNRGLDKQVVIEYGKNLTDLVADNDLSEVYSELLPYATYMDDSGTSHTVTGDPVPITSVITRTKTLVKDFSHDFEGQMTPAQVTAKGQEYVRENPLGYETPSLTVSFVNLQHDAPYPAAAATVDLCDTVTIRYTALGVDVKAKIVKAEYDTLNERYTKLTIGTPRANMADTVANLTDVTKIVVDYPQMWQSAIAEATAMITGNNGGHVVLHEGPDGKPFELLVMDNEDITQATKVWRWTQGGLGYSTNGYAGPYELAITADGRINADFVSTGMITDQGGYNSWNLNTGALTITNGSVNITTKYDTTDLIKLNAILNEFQKVSSELAPEHIKHEFLAEQTNLTTATGAVTRSRTHGGYTAYRRVTYASGTSKNRYIKTDVQDSGVSLYYILGSDQEEDAILRASLSTTGVNFLDQNGAYTAKYNNDGIVLNNGNYTKTITADGPPSVATSGTTTIETGAYRTLGTIQFNAGVYLIMVNARFPSNATGRRVVLLSNSSNSGTSPTEMYMDSRNATNGTYTNCKFAAVRSFGDTTVMYINAYQNSGGDQDVFYRTLATRLA